MNSATQDGLLSRRCTPSPSIWKPGLQASCLAPPGKSISARTSPWNPQLCTRASAGTPDGPGPAPPHSTPHWPSPSTSPITGGGKAVPPGAESHSPGPSLTAHTPPIEHTLTSAPETHLDIRQSGTTVQFLRCNNGHRDYVRECPYF